MNEFVNTSGIKILKNLADIIILDSLKHNLILHTDLFKHSEILQFASFWITLITAVYEIKQQNLLHYNL